MSQFTRQELKTCQIVGGAVLAVSLVMVVIAAICKEVGVGVPEFMQFTKIVGGALAIGAGAFLGIAVAKGMLGGLGYPSVPPISPEPGRAAPTGPKEGSK